jgi:hypothetical protein
MLELINGILDKNNMGMFANMHQGLGKEMYPIFIVLKKKEMAHQTIRKN